MSKYSNYDPMTAEEQTALYFKVEALETLVKNIAYQLQMKTQNDEDNNIAMEIDVALNNYKDDIS